MTTPPITRDIDGIQDDLQPPEGGTVKGTGALPPLLAFVGGSTQRSTADTLAWYSKNTTTASIGFNPDGMCLKVCRVARNLPGVYPSALAAQQATPEQHRVRDISKIRPGMVMYFDDPRDGNPYGHIVTVVATPKPEGEATKLSEIQTVTNSAEKGRLTRVAADYYPIKWGDPFTFAATWLNGHVLDIPPVPVPEPPPPSPIPTPEGYTRGARIDAVLELLREAKPAHRNREAVRRMIEAGESIKPWRKW